MESKLVDVNECEARPCDSIIGASCRNFFGGFECICADGQAAEGDSCVRDPCDDVDCLECETCYNVGGEAICTKKAGFDHGEAECVDLDECELGFDNCDAHAECVNELGNYRCECHDGYEKDESALCVDVDECASDEPVCDQVCANAIGSFSCSCNSGFTIEEDGTTCSDIDECANSACGDNSNCYNSAGSYECECKDQGLKSASSFF